MNPAPSRTCTHLVDVVVPENDGRLLSSPACCQRGGQAQGRAADAGAPAHLAELEAAGCASGGACR
eukprot:scaffold206659_cov15-Tisochrysis_lutea.AAC.1